VKKSLLHTIGYFVFLLCVVSNTSAQQMSTFSQYMANGFHFNPAMAGSFGYTKFDLMAKKQWMGIDHSPSFQAVSAQTRMLKQGYNLDRNSIINRFSKKTKGRVGLGVRMFNDMNGLISKTGGQLVYAYHIHLRNSQLSFGLAGSFYQFRLREEDINYDVSTDPLIANSNKKNFLVPDVNTGIFINNRLFNAGLSVCQVTESALKIGQYARKTNYHLQRHYFLYGGLNINIDDWLLYPSMLVKSTEQLSFIQSDFSFSAAYLQKYWAGVGYRTKGFVSWIDAPSGGDLVFFLKARLDNIIIGYGIEHSLNPLGANSAGTHEILLSYQIGSSARKYRWKDRF